MSDLAEELGPQSGGLYLQGANPNLLVSPSPAAHMRKMTHDSTLTPDDALRKYAERKSLSPTTSTASRRLFPPSSTSPQQPSFTPSLLHAPSGPVTLSNYVAAGPRNSVATDASRYSTATTNNQGLGIAAPTEGVWHAQ
ncbi:MAG: hypothetical protein INR71_16265 [Terriglobus roseus]|nr:hypothetical protein [Terriglobus roseus]